METDKFKEQEVKETYEAVRHFSSLCSNLRLLLIAQAYIWFSATALAPWSLGEMTRLSTRIVTTVLVAGLAIGCTLTLEVFHSHYLSFWKLLVQRAKEIESHEGPWGIVVERRATTRRFEAWVLDHAGISMAALIFLAAIANILLLITAA